MNITLSDLKTPTVSAAGLHAVEIVASENFNIDELIETINTDAMLCGVLIKYANAPVYRRYAEVRSVKNAINILGTSFVRGAVMIATMRAYVEPMTPSKELLWERALSRVLLAKLITLNSYKELIDDIELTAIIQDIGALVWCSNFPEEYSELLENAVVQQRDIEELEFNKFNVRRKEITNYVANMLRMPEVTKAVLDKLYSAERIVQICNDIDKQTAILALVRLAEKRLQQVDCLNDEELQQLQSLQLLTGITDDRLDQVYDDYNDKINEIIKI